MERKTLAAGNKLVKDISETQRQIEAREVWIKQIEAGKYSGSRNVDLNHDNQRSSDNVTVMLGSERLINLLESEICQLQRDLKKLEDDLKALKD